MEDSGGIGHPLGANHLFDLVPNRRSVLEQKCEMRSDCEPSAFLLMNEQRPQNPSHPLPLFEAQDIVLTYFFHFDHLRSLPAPGPENRCPHTPARALRADAWDALRSPVRFESPRAGSR